MNAGPSAPSPATPRAEPRDEVQGAGTGVPPRQSAGRSAAKLAGQLLLLLLVSFATVAAFVLFVPEVNDYHRASRLKHERLASLPSPKIVLVGGSNLAFGIDSPLIEKQTGLPVVNMGMDGYLGVEFILNEAEPYLKPSDLVVVVLEHDGYIIPPEGAPENQFAVIKANPAAFGYLTTRQRLDVVESFVGIAQAKVTRLVRDRIQTVQRWVTGTQDERQLAEHVGRFDGFNAQGDLTTHLDIKLSRPPDAGMDLTSKSLEPVAKILQDFSQRMQAKGVRVLFSYPPVADFYYQQYKESIDRIHELLTAQPGLVAPSPPADFVLPQDWFFDTVYHVTRHGREVRTRKLVADIQGVLRPRQH